MEQEERPEITVDSRVEEIRRMAAECGLECPDTKVESDFVDNSWRR
jgi:hypothetical protein